MKLFVFIAKQPLRLFNAILYSLSGLKAAFLTEPAFALEVVLFIILAPVAVLLPVPGLAKAVLLGSLLLVLIVELVNSGIEAVTDRISLERHPLAKKAKDVGSAAVLLSLLNVLFVWGLVLFG